MRKGSSELSTIGATVRRGDPSRVQCAHARSTLSSADTGGGRGRAGVASSSAEDASDAALAQRSSSGSARWAAAGGMAPLGFRQRRRRKERNDEMEGSHVSDRNKMLLLAFVGHVELPTMEQSLAHT
jgi:hypothetical protein